MGRKIIIIDPLPNVLDYFQKALRELNSANYTGLSFYSKPKDFESVVRDIVINHSVLLLASYSTISAPVLNSYRRISGKRGANSLDLLDGIITESKAKGGDPEMPVIMPHLNLTDEEELKQGLSQRPEIKYTLTCLVRHLSGNDEAYTHEQVYRAFARHIEEPAEQNYTIKEYITEFDIK